MIQKADPRSSANETAVGADVGATLAKWVIRRGDGDFRVGIASADSLDEVARDIAAAAPRRVGLTGGRAPQLAARLSVATASVGEFDAWGRGARAILEAEGEPCAARFLLASLGTGTSVMKVEGDAVSRVGGTALGGGTVMGLGAALVGCSDFAELAALAKAGDRRRVDLLVRDIYHGDALPLPGDVNAASFAKLPTLLAEGTAQRADLAHAIMGMVGENIALIVSALAAAADVDDVIFGGSTLRENESLIEIVGGLCAILGHPVRFLPRGEFVGAFGALELAGAEG